MQLKVRWKSTRENGQNYPLGVSTQGIWEMASRNGETFSYMKPIIYLALQKLDGIMHVTRIPIKENMINREVKIGQKKMRFYDWSKKWFKFTPSVELLTWDSQTYETNLLYFKWKMPGHKDSSFWEKKKKDSLEPFFQVIL